MATKMLGKDFRLYLDSSLVGYSENLSYTLTNNLIPSTELESGEWDSYLQYGKGFKGSVNALMLRTAGDSSRGYNYVLTNFVTTNASLYAEFTTPEISGNQTMRGCVFTDSLTMNSNDKNSIATWSASFTGTGAFTIGTA